MHKLDRLIKDIRRKKRVSQRAFAEDSGISFRQLQRIEKDEADITLKKLLNILHSNCLDLEIVPIEPDWKVLTGFGMPLNIERGIEKKHSYNFILKHLVLGVQFLLDKGQQPGYGRYFDSFKSLLLALKIHYPARFALLEKIAGINISSAYCLHSIEGRHIKLYRISLGSISQYLKKVNQKANHAGSL